MSDRLRLAVARFELCHERERLRRCLVGVLEACRAWSIDVLVTPQAPVVAELLATLERPPGLAVIADRQPIPGLPGHDVLAMDDFAFRNPLVERRRIIAARRDARLVVVHGPSRYADWRHLWGTRSVVIDARDGESLGLYGGGVERPVWPGEGVVAFELGGRRPVVIAASALIDLGDARLADYAAWNCELVAALDSGALDLAGARARIDAATPMLLQRGLFAAERARYLRELLVELDELDSTESMLRYLREVFVAAGTATATLEPEPVGRGPSEPRLQALRERARAGTASLVRADLRELELERDELVGLDLRHAKLDGARLAGCDLERADLRGASLVGADLRAARLWQTRLDGADLRNAALEGVEAHACSLVGACLDGVEIGGSHWTQCDWFEVEGQLRARTPWLRGDELALEHALVTRIDDERAFVGALAWSPDGELLALAAWSIRLWRRADRRVVATLEHERSVECMAWSPDGRELAVGDQEGAVIWSLAEARPRLRVATGSQPVRALAWSASGEWLALNVGAERAWVRSTRDGSAHEHFDVPRHWGVTELGWDRDGETLLVRAGPELHFVRRGIAVRTVRTHNPEFVWLGDGRYASVGSHRFGLYHLGDPSQGWISDCVPAQIEGLQASPDGTLAAGFVSTQVLIWSLADGRLLESHELGGSHDRYREQLVWSSRHDLAVAGGGRPSIIEVGRGTDKLELVDDSRLGCAWSPGARSLAIARQQVQIWDRDWTSHTTFATSGNPTALAWAPDGARLAVGTAAGVVEVRDLDGVLRAEIVGLRYVRALGWSRDGARIYVDDGGSLSRWTNRGRPLPELAMRNRFGSVALLEGPRCVVVDGDDYELIDIDDASVLARGSLESLQPMGCSPDGAWLVLGSSEQLAFVRTADLQVLGRPIPVCPWIAPAWSHDGSRVAIVCEHAPYIRVLATEDFTELAAFGDAAPGSVLSGTVLVWSSNDRALLCGQAPTLLVMRSRDGTPLGRIDFHDATALLRSHDGAFTIAGDPRDVELVLRREQGEHRLPLAGLVELQDRARVLSVLADLSD